MPWDLTGNSGTNPATNFLGTRDDQPLVIRTNGTQAFRIDGSGAVGIGGGTFAPSHVSISEFGQGPSTLLNLRRIERQVEAGEPPAPGLDVHFILDPDPINGGFHLDLGGQANRRARIHLGDPDRGDNPVTTLGNVGIGTTNPAEKLEVVGGIRSSGSGGGSLQALNPNNQEASVALSWHNGVARIRIGGNGVGSANGLDIQRTQDRSLMRIHNDGSIEVPGDVLLTGADCAENFDVEEAQSLEPGMVMVIGDEEKVCQCTQAYDKRVAGVISGAGDYKPGMILGNDQSKNERLPVALTGKVYCKVDTQYAPIAVGDLLTTSPSPGHAMKASDPLKAFGAILGKALRPLKEGQGLIPVLVALQ